ncbi:alpha/beta hydrolase family protein [Kutzneria sp. NPDC052558]|uniref:alpha/beta hydrolase family protein n=1 Tax=Kutzneria sp. NPDC052558 TaxID=3364121 RepID=UPI0037CBF6C2
MTFLTAAAMVAATVTGIHLPAPTGPLPVGSSTLHLVDRSRPDIWAPANSRELIVSLYYPAFPGGPPVPYASAAETTLLVQAQGFPAAAAQAFADATTNSHAQAPLPGRHPLVLLSPGLGAPRYTLTTLAEDLASHGYVVASLDHAYESVGTLFPGDRMLPCLACEAEDLRPLVLNRAKDASFVIDQLTTRYPGLIDPNRIGMAGHSIGGASALAAMEADPRIKAGVDMDGAFHVDARDGMSRPFLMLGNAGHGPGGQDSTWDQVWPELSGWKRWLTVTGSNHYSFTDAPTLLAQFGAPMPGLPADRAVAITRDYVTAFFDQTLSCRPEPILAGPTPSNPEVTFNSP